MGWWQEPRRRVLHSLAHRVPFERDADLGAPGTGLGPAALEGRRKDLTKIPLTIFGDARRRQPVETERPTYGIAEWAAALRAKRAEEELAEEELAAATREREDAALGVRKNVMTNRDEGIEVPSRYGEFFDSR